MNYTYILKCGDGSLYTGWTNDLEKRVRTHQAGKGGKYTRSRLPVELVWQEAHADRREAMRREYALKQLTRAQKLALITAKQGPPSTEGGQSVVRGKNKGDDSAT